MDKDALLKEYYFKPEHPAANAGHEKLLKVLQKKYPGVLLVVISLKTRMLCKNQFVIVLRQLM